MEIKAVYQEMGIRPSVLEFGSAVEKDLKMRFDAIDRTAEYNQLKVIKAMQEEQTLICYGLRGALQGLIEQGCDGPCKDALNLLDKHLNKEAHHPDL